MLAARLLVAADAKRIELNLPRRTDVLAATEILRSRVMDFLADATLIATATLKTSFVRRFTLFERFRKSTPGANSNNENIAG
jgi:hypothetical protein